MHIRTATLSDAEELRDYAIRLFAEDLPGIFRRSDPSIDEERDFIRARIEPANSTLLLAENDGHIIGIVAFHGETLEEERHAGTFALSVTQECRGTGVGTALLEALFEWAPSAGISRIQGWAWATNPGAIALYERMGFRREGLCRKAVMREGQAIDVVLVAKLLDE